MEILQYCVERIHIDITYKYEEALLIIEDPTMVTYLENALSSLGIKNASRRRVCQENAIARYELPQDDPNLPPQVLKRLTKVGDHFNFGHIFHEVLTERSRSYISSINPDNEPEDFSVSILPL